ncbi:MAG: hypothetical protein C3F12_14995 [Candidatus Methylomirabilota bacterium]|nr:MAG: hypothetical protein C3F12_14995 [candidate division NC10 bacterium]
MIKKRFLPALPRTPDHSRGVGLSLCSAVEVSRLHLFGSATCKSQGGNLQGHGFRMFAGSDLGEGVQKRLNEIRGFDDALCFDDGEGITPV